MELCRETLSFECWFNPFECVPATHVCRHWSLKEPKLSILKRVYEIRHELETSCDSFYWEKKETLHGLCSNIWFKNRLSIKAETLVSILEFFRIFLKVTNSKDIGRNDPNCSRKVRNRFRESTVVVLKVSVSVIKLRLSSATLFSRATNRDFI